MSEVTGNPAVRKRVSAAGGSCDIRCGPGLVESMGKALASGVGTPGRCALVVGTGADGELVERLRRQLTDGGFRVHIIEMDEGTGARSLASFGRLVDAFADAGISADDLVLASGGVDGLSVASLAASLWGHVMLASVPLDLDAMVEALTPRLLDVEGRSGFLGVPSSPKYLFCDPEVMDLTVGAESSILARVLMVASAMADGEKSFSALWDKAELVAAGDADDVLDGALDALKSRGRLVSSSALSLRRSLDYGMTFARVLRALGGEGLPASTCRAEALRFAARLSCSQGRLSVEDVLAQDELLDLFGAGEFAGAMDPDRLFDALKHERFLRSNRFHLCLPQSLGKVRPTSVDDAVLKENLEAWCESHA